MRYSRAAWHDWRTAAIACSIQSHGCSRRAVGTRAIALLIGLSLAMPAVVIDAWRSRPPVLDASQLPTVPPDDPSWDRWSAWRVREMDQPLDDEHFILDAAVDANATDTPEDLSPDDLAKEDA